MLSGLVSECPTMKSLLFEIHQSLDLAHRQHKIHPKPAKHHGRQISRKSPDMLTLIISAETRDHPLPTLFSYSTLCATVILPQWRAHNNIVAAYENSVYQQLF